MADLLRCLLATSLLGVAIGATACGDDTGTGGEGGGAGGGGDSVTDQDIQPVVETYATQVHTAYDLALSRAKDLQGAIDAFVAAPSQDTLDAARDAWNAARPPYLETEVFRFYNGPIDNEETGPEGRINGWPLDEFYIDYVEGEDTSGIINDLEGFPEITKQVIADANENGGEKNLSAGFHAIEFLLWGQDQSETGPGDRPYTDYVVDGTAANQDRRAAYLTAVTELLVEDIESVTSAWVDAEGSYASTFVAEPPRDALKKMLVGMGSLSGAELATERMNNAYQERDQEEEHSCFSDTTHVDHLHDLIGIENVYLGRLGSDDATGIDELVKKVDPALDEKMKADLTAAKTAIESIPQPFDQAIQDDAAGGGREKISAAIDSLQKLAGTTVEVATALGVEITIE